MKPCKSVSFTLRVAPGMHEMKSGVFHFCSFVSSSFPVLSEFMGYAAPYFPKGHQSWWTCLFDLAQIFSGCNAPISPGLGPLHWEYTGLTVGPLVLMMAHILYGIISLSLCNITTLLSIHSRAFHKALASMMGYSDHWGRFPAHPQSSPWD